MDNFNCPYCCNDTTNVIQLHGDSRHLICKECRLKLRNNCCPECRHPLATKNQQSIDNHWTDEDINNYFQRRLQNIMYRYTNIIENNQENNTENNTGF